MHWRACMNHIYRVIYNQHTATYQAVPEISKGAHKTHSEHMVDGTLTPFSQSNVSFFRTVFTTLAMLIANLGMQQYVYAAPTGGQVVAGQANITQAGAVTNIHQSSQNAAINWQQFNIKPTETVNFKQPNAQAVTLNRVIGNEKSVIDGAMNANGKVFITNPNGTIIGKNAQINVGGLVATTANISNDDFMNGRYQFHGGSQGAIENLGQITVPEGGVVALIAPIVKNGGTITAPKANVLLASAERFSITLPDNQNFAYTLDQGTLQGLVDNGGAILADGGHVVLTAKGIDTVKKSLIKHSGVIEANIVQNKNGVIELLGDLDNTRLEVSGTLKAEAKVQGDGGFIETSASQLDISEQANISTQAKNGKTGTWLIDPKDFTVAPSGGDTTGAVVSKGLAQNNVTLKSRGGAKEGKGDVVINDEISWNKNTLTLNAENDIHINKTLNGSGTAKLALEYGQGTTDGGESDYHLSSHINLPKGNRFSLRKGYNGEIYKFFVIHEMPNITISGEGHRPGSELSEQFVALGNNIDLSITKDFPNFTGWKIPNGAKIHGLGHKLYNLSIKTDETSSEYLGSGLFQILENGELRDIGIDNVDINNSGEGLYAGGLVGYAKNSIIRNSYATGSISTTGYESEAGGLIGIIHDSEVKNSYAHSTVSTSGETAEAGGLVGYDIGGSSIINSYAAGKVSTKDSEKGGLIGYSNSGDYAQFNMGTYYDKDLLNSTSNSYGSEKSSVEMKQKSTFKDWDFDTVWRIDEGNDYPRLRALTEGTIIITPNKTDVGVQAHDLKKVYDGKEVSTEEHLRTIATANGYSDIVSVSGLKDGDTLSSLGGLTYGGTWQGAKNAGKYSIVPSGLNGGQKYEIKYGEGSLTIDKRPITIIANKVYDGTNVARVYDDNEQVIEEQIVSLANTVSGDDVRVKKGTEGVLKGSDALSGYQSLAELGTLKLEGNSAENYELVTHGSRWLMSKKPLRLIGGREYDGSPFVNGIDLKINPADIAKSDENKLFLNVYSGDIELDSSNVPTQKGEKRKIISTKGFEIGGEVSDNYIIDKDNSQIEIIPRAIAVEVSKEYDGNNEFTKGFKFGNIVDGETVNVHVSKATVSGKDNISDGVDYNKFETISIAVPDSNYKFDKERSFVAAKILPKKIKITPNSYYEKFYYQKNPEFNYVHEKLIGSDKISGGLVGYIDKGNIRFPVDKESDAGEHKMDFGLHYLDAGKNYEFVLDKTNTSILNIKPLPIIVKANNQEYSPAWYNPIQGIKASLHFKDKDYSIIIPNNGLDYPKDASTNVSGMLGLYNAEKLNLITPKSGDYKIGNVNIASKSKNYTIEFIPGIYKVYDSEYIPVVSHIRGSLYAIEGAGLTIGKVALEDTGKSVDTLIENAKNNFGNIDWGNAPDAAVAIVTGIGQLGLDAAGLVGKSTSDLLVYAVKGIGIFHIEESNKWTDEEKELYTKRFELAVDLVKFSTDLASGVSEFADGFKTNQDVEMVLYNRLRENGLNSSEAWENIKTFRETGLIDEYRKFTNAGHSLSEGAPLIYNMANALSGITDDAKNIHSSQ